MHKRVRPYNIYKYSWSYCVFSNRLTNRLLLVIFVISFNHLRGLNSLPDHQNSTTNSEIVKQTVVRQTIDGHIVVGQTIVRPTVVGQTVVRQTVIEQHACR